LDTQRADRESVHTERRDELSSSAAETVALALLQLHSL